MKGFKFFLPLAILALATSCSAINNQGETLVDPTGIAFEFDSYTIEQNDTLALKATVSPTNANNKEIVWSISTGSSYISVDDFGVVTGKKVGSGKVKATIKDTKLYATCTVKVLENVIPVTGISFSQTSKDVELNKTITLSPTVSPSNASNKNITWSVADSSVASVTSGTVKGLKKGKTTVTATTVDGGFKASVEVNVYTNPVTGVSLSKSTLGINEGSSASLTATVSPSNATNKEVTWTTSNSSVVKVNNGELTAVKVGTATVTATTVDGGFTASCNVTVNEKPLGDAWTVLMYVCGADLESQNGLASSDIQEILSVSGQPDDVNIVIETGGANSWKSSYGYGISSSKLERWHVANKSLVKDTSLSTYTSMGESSTLQSFIEYGLKTYPAEKTALILWNHGGGLQGSCFDEKKNDDGLEPKEVISALSAAFKNCGIQGQKLEWIGYDCCLMQVQDIAELNSKYFNYMIASEESESGYGWDYDNWVDDLYAKKSTTTILKAIVDSFITDNGGTSSRQNDQTLSYLNLSYMEEYRTAWENMAGQLKNKITSSNKSSFGTLVNSAKKYADDDYCYYGLFDAKDFVDKLSNNSAFNPGSTYTTAVLNAHSNLVEYSSCGKGAGNSNGLCMYWNIATISDSWYGSYTTNDYNNYDSTYNFPNWVYLNKTYGGTVSVSSGWGY